ncbi:phospholipase [Halarchaeum sp. CBA1220]|uniref:phospholipase D-like domain-containing protein n=1 Tax=Halarchaeum sp. CBA1220 TaxID=1853682 RepID=UPI000F3A840D|nr:phospholipase D-like domain-containing protein [Halarchaeum sp. CBA1220]QLC34196.1 phospholipase [Halarchaeum sp. CBA1220]
MSRRFATSLCLLLLAGTLAASPPAVATPASGASSGTPTIVAVYPNPVAERDAGEFVTVRFPEETALGSCALADDEGRVALPERTVTGTVTLSTAPNRTRRLVPGRVLASAVPSLANAGEDLVLLCDGTVVDAASYRDAPEGEVSRDGAWRVLGRTAFAVSSVANADATVFALPDAPEAVRESLRGADDRLLVGGYTFTSERVAAILANASARGVDVRVLVEGGPVGGVAEREARVLDGLVEAGVEVTVLDGPYARYPFHHAKYAVVDDAVLVTSENWKPSGIGGRGTRGWGALVRNATLADSLAAVHRADSEWVDGVPWQTYKENATFQESEPANATYPRVFAPLDADVDDVSLVVSPDTSRDALLGFVRGANESLLVEQMGIGTDTVLLNATVAAAERGVRVRVLVSGAWYAREENAALVERLNERARRDGLDLRAKLAAPRGRYGTLHVKGAVADEERVLVGSVNWNENAVNRNRETELVLADPEVGAYYARLFLADWRGGVWTLPVLVAGVALAGALLAAWYLRREIAFERADAAVGWQP